MLQIRKREGNKCENGKKKKKKKAGDIERIIVCWKDEMRTKEERNATSEPKTP